jgi:hypothetical protein
MKLFKRLHAAMHRVDAYLARMRGDESFAQDCINRAVKIELDLFWSVRHD